MTGVFPYCSLNIIGRHRRLAETFYRQLVLQNHEKIVVDHEHKVKLCQSIIRRGVRNHYEKGSDSVFDSVSEY